MNLKNALGTIKGLFKTGFFHIFGGSVLNKSINFLSTIVLVRVLTKAEYGVFTYAWNIYSFILLLSGMGMDPAIIQLCGENAKNIRKQEALIKYGTSFGLKFNFLLVVIILAVGFFVPLKIDSAKGVLISTSFLPFCNFLFVSSAAVLRVKKENQKYSALSIIYTVLLFVFSIIGAYIFRENGVIIAQYVTSIITIIIAVKFYKVVFFKKDLEALSLADKKSMHNVAFVSMCNNSLSLILHLIAVFVLGIFVPDELVLASYKAATIIPTALAFIPNSLVIYLYPYYAEHKGDGEWCLRTSRKIYFGIGAFNAIVSILLCLFAPFIVTLLFGTEYADAIPIFRVLAINYFFSGTFRTLSGNLLVTQRKLKFNLMVGIITGVLNIIVDVIFIKLWGSMGAALATILVVLVSGAMNTTYLFYTFKKYSKNNK